MKNMDTENGQNHIKMENRKNIIKIIQLVLLCACSFLLAGCGMGKCSIEWEGSTNTREEAVQLTHGERLSRSLFVGSDYWFYFDLDETAVVALEYINDWYIASYFYAESDTMPELMLLDGTDQGNNYGKLDPDTFDETKRLAGNGFEVRELAAGKYYFHLHGLQGLGHMASAMFLIVDDLPALPTGTVQNISSNASEVRLEDGYYKLDLTEERSDFTVDSVIPEGVSHRMYFYYGENNSVADSFYFYNGGGENCVSSSTITLPIGRTIVRVSTYVGDSYGGTQPDATVKYTVVKAAPGTVFDREVSALPDLPLGEELNLSEFNFEFEFTGYMSHVLNSMKIYLTEDSVLSVRVKDLSYSSLTVSGYYNTNPLNSVKKQSGSVLFGWSEYIDDMEQSFNLPAGLNLIELRVNLERDYSAEVFAAATIEFNVSPANG